MKKTITLVFIGFVSIFSFGQNKILFDNSKGEVAGNADWIIDADTYNLGISSTGEYLGGFESNAQRYPTPAQSGITSSTTEDYWTGAISYWAVDCAKKGYTVETLPWNGQITYGVSTNTQDLSNYKAFIVTEPNLVFTASEKAAIIHFVQNGGGLFMIADHDVSDRNGDGWDSPHIWNDLMSTNTVTTNPFGITFDYVDLSATYSNVLNSSTDPILHGTAGNVTKMQLSGGTTMTLDTAANASVKGVIFKTGASTTGTTNVLFAYGTYGSGKFCAVGDSSIADDGTGDPNDTLYDGYITDAQGNHQKLLMNATIWLMTSTLATENFQSSDITFSIMPNPTQNKNITVSYNITNQENTQLEIVDNLGRTIISKKVNNLDKMMDIDASYLENGIYFCKISNSNSVKTVPFILQ